ncbi:putative protein OS=Tsukamurella paurometabola (strain ATCC 8368 / DSM / CCUG 35730 /CIP 100753 / JCM 10117 / KCTC 9821 / NBRC 16120 / NCIMB 702349/ NCTC 13040) OX=521096 GN=Tpau_1405 PE=4 SV=1 [Tsukamurella paurometabola]|uniref:Uncharacterized protein n=1 Tax=Tsukamurella paurometabola (strain ATCC 8368 / DSM 20162 / CCUG 35730 / CIP 100753 / JCM 10117 / KCTC 9821 / NBRC 16120 / NCIMB 702349 / NCTC 13040) TaxID=521096 RepID=D5UXE1_TSUPD|nr:hypothetical protein [Tsukamurella paurometabola]ADG78033.1 hypothetical protein Tpau_1405 [Tsukamurella paurometabola DSM 20162]SUP29870.1 Uncharacterised protein [Tsukamurella paurometabola]
MSVLAGCSEPTPAPTRLPDGYPVAQVPVVGELRKTETIEVGHPMWRITVVGDDTIAGSRALLGAGLVPVAPNVPLDAGAVGAVYRGHGFTVAISSNSGAVTYVVSPTPGV